MMKDFFRLKSVEVRNSPKLYPKGIQWQIQPGMNAIVGGTGLGKTTLINTMLFGLFGEIGRSSKRNTPKIDRDYFIDRLNAVKNQDESSERPIADVVAEFGKNTVCIQRDLLSGRILKCQINKENKKPSDYEHIIASQLGLSDFASELLLIVDHLSYVSEERYLLTWDNQIQNEVLSLLFTDQQKAHDLNKYWDEAQSADSEYRNIRHQAYRLEKELESIAPGHASDTKISLESKLAELSAARDRTESGRRLVAERYQKEKDHLTSLEIKINEFQWKYNEIAKDIDIGWSQDLDDILTEHVFTSPTQESVYGSIKKLVKNSHESHCPCCGNIPKHDVMQLKNMQLLVKSNHCPICESALIASKSYSNIGNSLSDKARQSETEIRTISLEIKKYVTEHEQTRSRIQAINEELSRIETELEKARDAEVKFLLANPPTISDNVSARRLMIKTLQADADSAMQRRDRQLKLFMSAQESFNKILIGINKEIADRFSHYAGRFLDEKCVVEFDPNGEFGKRRGPQLNAPHSAFYPVIGGELRTSPESLSDAQRLFVDLAFRMAILTTWSNRSKKTITLIVETPEGSVDIAYMVRVAEMLRQFAKEGNTVVITTNLNNDEFLPALFAETPKGQRENRIYNLLKFGKPKKVQKEYLPKFKKIINKTINQ